LRLEIIGDCQGGSWGFCAGCAVCWLRCGARAAVVFLGVLWRTVDFTGGVIRSSNSSNSSTVVSMDTNGNGSSSVLCWSSTSQRRSHECACTSRLARVDEYTEAEYSQYIKLARLRMHQATEHLVTQCNLIRDSHAQIEFQRHVQPTTRPVSGPNKHRFSSHENPRNQDPPPQSLLHAWE